jgi:hypothetical protein
LNPLYSWFGGKRRIVKIVWAGLDGDFRCKVFTDPFCGSAAIILGSPRIIPFEILNDKDAFVCNFLRAVKYAPRKVAEFMDWPTSEYDMEARHRYLCHYKHKFEFAEKIRKRPMFYSAKRAGWWAWGSNNWLGTGWCHGVWNPDEPKKSHGRGIRTRGGKRPLLANAARSFTQIPCIAHLGGGGVITSLPAVAKDDTSKSLEHILRVSARLRLTKICGGDWKRVLHSPSLNVNKGLSAVFLDPPYGADRHECYREEDFSVANEVRVWAEENGKNPLFRIALCGYEGEHNALEKMGWSKVGWKATGGFGNVHIREKRRKSQINRCLERVWFSPACLHYLAQQKSFEALR